MQARKAISVGVESERRPRVLLWPNSSSQHAVTAIMGTLKTNVAGFVIRLAISTRAI